MTARTYTFETPTDVIAMNSLIATFTKTTSTAKKDAIRKVFDSMACEHGYITSIKGTDAIYHWDRINYISRIWTHTHDCIQYEQEKAALQVQHDIHTCDCMKCEAQRDFLRRAEGVENPRMNAEETQAYFMEICQQSEDAIQEVIEAPVQVDPIITQEVEINGIAYTIVGRDEQELAQETAKLEQEINAQWQEVNQMQQPSLFDRLHKGESVNVKTAQGIKFTIQPSYWDGIVLGYTVIQNGEIVPGYEGLMLDTDTAKDWLAGLEEDIPELTTPLQGVASFFSSLAVFSSHDILPLDVTDITLYEQLKSQWDAMGGDALCRCDWCDAEPLQYQEELQHAEHLQERDSMWITLDPEQNTVAHIFDNGSVTIIGRDQETIYLSAREAYALLSELYNKRDEIYKAAQQNESEPAQKKIAIRYIIGKELNKFAVYVATSSGDPKRLIGFYDTHEESTHAAEEQYGQGIIYASIDDLTKQIRHHLGAGLLSWPREERISGRYGLIALFDEDWDQSPWQTDITSLTGKHGSLVAVLDGEEIELGKGICFTEQHYDNEYIGLRPPSDYLEEEWLSPSQLRKVDGRVTHKPVELWFVEQ